MSETNNQTKNWITNVAIWAFVIGSMSFVMFSGFNIGMKFSDSINPTVKNEENNCTCNSSEGTAKVITDELLDQLLAIAGVKAHGKNIDDEVIFLNGNAEVSAVAPKTRAYMIYKYAEYNDMLEIVPGSVYSNCRNTLGYCQGITVDNYNKIAKLYGAKDNPNTIFEPIMIFNNMYLYVYNKPAQTFIYTHDYSASYDNDDVVIVDNVSGVAINNTKNYVTREVTYRFKLDDNNEYYLFSVKSK